MTQLLRLILFIIVLIPSSLKSQIGGTKYIPGDYPSLANFITQLNTNGVSAGGLIVNIAAGYTETAPAGGFILGSAILNPSLTGTSKLTIQKDPSGVGANPLFTAFTGTTLSSDGIFKFLGTDYVSVNSIDLQEAAGNNNSTKQMEFGFALLNLNKDDGCWSFFFNNCSITLKRANIFSKGIFTSHSDANLNPFIITQASGEANNVNINGCNISNCYVPVSINGDQTMQDNDIYIGATIGNIISNYGGSNSNTIGINISAVSGITINSNTVTLPVGSTRDAYGIYIDAFCTGDVYIANNVISVSSSATTRTLAAINTDATALTTLTIRNNLIHNCDYSSATGGLFRGIADNGSGVGCSVDIIGNTISGITYANAGTNGNGNVYAIYKPAGNANTVNVSSNNIVNFSLFGKGGGVFAAIYIQSALIQQISNNGISNNTINGTLGILGTIYGILCTAGANSCNVVGNAIVNNQILKVSNTGSIYGIVVTGNPVNEDISSNFIAGLTSTGNTSVTGIRATSNANNRTISSNNIASLSSSGGTVCALYTDNSNPQIFKNKIFSLSSSGASGSVNGITIAGGSASAYNNIIGDCYTPSSANLNAINGILISGGTIIYIDFNTININASSSSPNFGSSAIYISSTVPLVALSDNIFCNTSTPGSASGFTAAFRYVSPPGGSYSNTSDNNLFYAGVPSANTLIYGETVNGSATNPQQTISAYKTYMAAHDRNSITENPPFSSINGPDVDYLHINPSIPTGIESGGKPIGGITDDIDGDTRNAIVPDIGADEFSGTPVILPVTFISFNVMHSINANILTWKTDIDINCRGFYVERSFNGIDFTAIHFINSNGNLFYQYIDSLTLSGIIYYRIREVDFNGKESISKIISSGNYGGEEGITVYPNPVVNFLNISFFTPTDIVQEFRIINSEGKTVMIKENSSKKGYTIFNIDISNLIRGMYILEINSKTPYFPSAKKVFKLIKV